jgi:hypothetical protein
VGRCGLDSSGAGQRVEGSCECGNEPTDSKKGREFLHYE